MSLAEALIEVWKQSLEKGLAEVELEGRRHRVGRTRNMGLRTVSFTFGDCAIEGIEQNPETSSRWAKLAQSGQRIMQFRCRGKYVANVCEGKLTQYPSWKALGLPE